MVEYGTAIVGATITLGTAIAPTTMNVCQLKIILYLHVSQLIQL